VELDLRIADVICSSALAVALSPTIWGAAKRTARRQEAVGIWERGWIAAALAAIGALLGWGVGVPGTLILVPVLVIGGAAALVDLRECRLPDPLTAALALSTLAAVLVAAGTVPPVAARAFAGAAIGAVVVVAGRVVGPDAVGWGDVKLAPSLTAWLAGAGWATLYAGLLAWSVLIAATALIAGLRRSAHGAVVPYGPAMVLGTIAAIAITG